MKKRHFQLLHFLLLSPLIINAQPNQDFKLESPDGGIIIQIDVGTKIQWSVRHKGQQMIVPSTISLQLAGGESLGENAIVHSSDRKEINREIHAINYKKAIIPDHCNQLTIQCNDDYGLIFRAYDDAVAYRFFTKKKDSIVVQNEEANFNFAADHKAFIPYMRDYRDGKIFNCSFESLYTEQNISQFMSDSLAFLPLLIDVGNDKKVVILEADLEDYPGMFLNINHTGKGFMGVYAPYPLEEEQVRRNLIPTRRADYIARTSGARHFPWRVVVISEQDKELLSNDIVQKLASPPRLEDVSWIEPGQAAWEWWNAIGISHVDFRVGMNTATYKYYIDFAAANGIRYIIIDEGGAAGFDLTKVIPAIDLQELIAHGNRNGVGIILWAMWHPLIRQMDTVFAHYSGMGIKGFKIDFIDRDDQKAVASTYEMARKAAEHQLIIDFHGIYKPTGLQRTYPNVVGYEGVKGLENVKWAHEDRKGDTWYVGAMSNWTARELTLDFSFLGEGAYHATVFKDGINADRFATDYKREVINISSGDTLTIQLSNGGGWAARIEKAE